MECDQLSMCCFAVSVKTCSIIMGIISAIFTFILGVIIITMLALESLANQAKETNLETGFTGLYFISIILVLVFIAKFIFDIFLVYGVMSERSGVIKACFIMCTMFFVLSMFIFFLTTSQFAAGTISLEFLYFCINIFLIFLIYGFYKLLNTREKI